MTLTTQLNPDYRSENRVSVGRDGTIRNPAGRPVEVTVEDVSMSGCMLASPLALPENQVLNIGLPGLGRREGRIVWRRGDSHGVQFLWPLSAAELKDVRSTDNLVRGPFPQSLENLLTPDTDGDHGRTVSRRGIALIAGVGALTWAGVGYLVAHLIA